MLPQFQSQINCNFWTLVVILWKSNVINLTEWANFTRLKYPLLFLKNRPSKLLIVFISPKEVKHLNRFYLILHFNNFSLLSSVIIFGWFLSIEDCCQIRTSFFCHTFIIFHYMKETTDFRIWDFDFVAS